MTQTSGDLVGQLILGRYRVIHQLAQGGMGVVYLGRIEGAAGFSKAVVIKRVIPDVENLAQSTAEFIREAQILSNLQHPGIVSVLDFGEEDDAYAMVLEYVNGYDLGRWLKYIKYCKRQMHWEQAVLICVRVLEALGYAHDFCFSDGASAEVLHRDISPGNVLLDVDGRVRLLDFGIARMGTADDAEKFTQTGVLRGKAPYLAPELFTGARASRASDIYACGVVLYQMLTGAHPFSADGSGHVMWRVVMEPPRPLRDVRGDLPHQLEACIERAIAKDPDKRTESAGRFAAELRACLQHDEAAIGASLRDLVSADFNGEMPKLLRIEALRARDRAWRDTGNNITPVVISQATGVAPVANLAATLQHQPRPELEAGPTSAATIHSSDIVMLEPRWRLKRSVLYAVGLATVLIASAINLVPVLRAAPPEQPRFIVVGTPETRAQNPAATTIAPAASPAVSRDAEPRSIAHEPTLGRKPRAPRHDSEAAELSRPFARQEAKLQACFERFASSIQGQPRITVSFDVAASGQVKSAALSPSSLAATPLGQCLLGVARRTEFGARKSSVRFTIPIQARKSGK